MSSVLTWEPFLDSERAQIGALEFFVCTEPDGASLYCDSMSFDQGCGRRGYASVEAAKSAAEELARHTFDELAALFAPVLRWDRDQHSTARIDGDATWVLEADCEEWSVWLRTGYERSVVRSGHRCTTRENNRRSAERELRALGVPFRTEDE